MDSFVVDETVKGKDEISGMQVCETCGYSQPIGSLTTHDCLTEL